MELNVFLFLFILNKKVNMSDNNLAGSDPNVLVNATQTVLNKTFTNPKFSNTTTGYVATQFPAYQRYSFAASFSGPWAVNVNGTILFERIGNMVFGMIENTIRTIGNSTAAGITTLTAVPESFWPTAQRSGTFPRILDPAGVTNVIGSFTMTQAGIIRFGIGTSAGNFTSTTSLVGVSDGTFMYKIS